MTQQQIPQTDLPYPGEQPPKRRLFRSKTAIILSVVIGCLALWAVFALILMALFPSGSTTHTVVYTASADAAYGSGRTGMVTAQAPQGATQQTGLLPITGTFTFHSGDFVYLSVQNGQGLGSVTCRITVDGVVVSENTAVGGYTIATCQGRVS